VLAAALLWGLAGCDTIPRKGEPAPEAAPVAEFRVPADARELAVVPGESLLQVFVHRGGAMAKLGHNHVVASHALAGTVYVTDDPLRTRFDLTIPVNELSIDEPGLREKAGADFPPNVPQNARDGTRRNLMSAALLDGVNYPTIRLRALEVAAMGAGYEVLVEVLLKGEARLVRAPVTIVREGASLRASGAFPLKQSQLGLTPFTAAMGALIVLDDMKVEFEIMAR
jgi:polyisoprenoid-binding protein YceI